jgi:predicted NBD/HSP70 family sugar kinase
MHTAGVDLGGTKVQGVVVDGGGKRLGEARGRTPTEGGPVAVVAEIVTVVKAAAKDAKVAAGKLAGIGWWSATTWSRPPWPSIGWEPGGASTTC